MPTPVNVQNLTPKRTGSNKKRKLSHQLATVTQPMRSQKPVPQPVQNNRQGSYTPLSRIYDRFDKNWNAVASNAQGKN